MSVDAAMAAMEDHAEALGALNRVTRERDRARDIAARLEEEIAEAERVIREAVGILGEYGDANHPAQLCLLEHLGEWHRDPLTAPDPQHPAYKALHRDAEVAP